MYKHSEYSPSSASRWLSCAASIKETKNHAVFTTSSAAEEGTLAHSYAELLLTYKEPETALKNVTFEMQDHIKSYVDYVRAFNFTPMLIEERLMISGLGANIYGTADVVGVTDKTLHVIDLKYGRMKVEAKDNAQGLLYMLGAQELMIKSGINCEKFSFTIYQPRINHIETWTISKDELYAKRSEIKQAVLATKTDNPAYNPTESNCRFCPAKTSCTALYNKVSAVLGSCNTDKIQDDQRLELIKNKTLILKFISDIEDEIINESKPLDGVEVVPSRPISTWHNEEEVIKLTKDLHLNLTISKLATPTQAKKLLGKDFAAFNGMVKKVSKSKKLKVIDGFDVID